MKTELEILKGTRKIILGIVAKLDLDQLNKIPESFNNNIAWNVAHLCVTQQLLCYRLSGLDVHIDEKWVESFRKGTSPEFRVDEKQWNEILEAFQQMPDILEKDLSDERFKSYQAYTTSTGFTIESIAQAVKFNNFHEGLHLGTILALRKLV